MKELHPVNIKPMGFRVGYVAEIQESKAGGLLDGVNRRSRALVVLVPGSLKS